MSGIVLFDTSNKRLSEADQHLVHRRNQRLCKEKNQKSINAMVLIQGYSDEDEMSDVEEQEKAKGSDEQSDEEGGVSYSVYRKELIKTMKNSISIIWFCLF
jgi:hypothetical protein